MQWTIPKLLAEIAFVLNFYTHSFSTVAKQWGVAMDKVHNMTIFFFCGPMVEKKVVFIQVFTVTVHVQKQTFHLVIGVGAPQDIQTTSSKTFPAMFLIDLNDFFCVV